MTILELLQSEDFSARVALEDRWLVVNDDGEFVVYSHPYRAKKVRILITTHNEDEAVLHLTGEAGNDSNS